MPQHYRPDSFSKAALTGDRCAYGCALQVLIPREFSACPAERVCEKRERERKRENVEEVRFGGKKLVGVGHTVKAIKQLKLERKLFVQSDQTQTQLQHIAQTSINSTHC